MATPARTIRVLHVDDEPDFAETAGTFVEQVDERITVETATSVSAGVDRLSDDPFDCIVSDHDMPGKDGLEFLEIVRRDFSDLPFILYTGKGSEEVASEAISAGVTDYLQKKGGTDQYTVLANRIVNAVEAHRAEQALKRRTRRDEAIARLSREGLEGTDLDSLFEHAVELVSEGLGTDQTVLLERSTDGEHLQVVAGTGQMQESADVTRVGTDQNLQAVAALSQPEPVVVDDVQSEQRFGIPPYLSDQDVTSGISASIGATGAPFGVIETYATTHRPVSSDDVRFVQNVANILGTVIERTDTQQRLRESEARFREIAELSPDTIFRVDTDGVFTYASPAVESLLDYDPEELLGTNFQQYVADDSLSAAIEGFASVCEGELVRKLELTLVAVDGSHVPVELSATPVEDEGEVVFVQGFTREISERKAREQQLQQSQNLVEALSTALPDYFFIYDADGVYLDVVTGWAGGLTMYEPEELIGQSVDDILSRDTAEMIQTAISEALARDTIRTVEYPVDTEDGTLWYEGNIAPIPDGYEGSDAVLLTARDITERRQREQLLTRLQERTATLMQTTTKQETGEVIVETAQEVLGAEMSGFHLRSDDAQLLEPIAFADTVRTGLDEPPAYDRTAESDPAATVVWDTFESGASRFITDVREHGQLAEVTPARSAIIQPVADYGVFIISSTEPHAFDETDRALTEILATSLTSAIDRVERERQLRAHEQRLETERDRLSALFEVIPEPVVQVRFEDDEPLVSEVNEAFEETFGYSGAEAAGRSLNDLIVPSDRQSEAKRIDDRAQTDGTIKQEVRRRTANGLGDFLFRSIPVGTSNEADEYFGVYFDISDLKSYERTLERQNERLDEFASIVSHDLRNPLTVAQGRLQFIADDCESEHIDAVSRAHERMETLIENILTLARDGQTEADVQPVELATVVTDCWATVQTGDATLDVASDQTIRASGDCLKQLLENLIRNAVEHGGDGVTVTVGDLDDGFYVADDGVGIPEDERAQLFEMGYSTAEHGTGLGMSIVEQIADDHGWDITVTESAEGGARFEFSDVTGVS